MTAGTPAAQRDSLTLFLMGSGGDGVITAGNFIARAAAHDGINCHMTKTFGPQIRGGESAVWLQLSNREIRSPARFADVLLVLSWRSYPRFRSQLQLAEGAVVIQDDADRTPPPEDLVDVAGNPVVPVSVPFKTIAVAEAGTQLSRNTVAVGFLTELLGLPAESIPPALERRLAKKGAATVANNLRAFARGQEVAREDGYAGCRVEGIRGDGSPRLIMTGNDAAALGALAAKVEFFAGYPITPASEILVHLAAQLPGRGGTVIQAEDEIAAMSMVIGATFGGKRSMTATSGPGLSLKAEALGLAAHAEMPCVIVNVQRGGPSTGLPTKTEQSDLQLMLYGAHGDAPRVVLAAENAEGCFDATVKAFYIAERYQTPVIVASDQLIGHRMETLHADALDEGNTFRKTARRLLPEELPSEPYLRYRLDGGPVTAMSYPGLRGCAYRTSGIVHNEDGSPSSDHATHQRMSEKLREKMALVLEEFPGVRRVGPANAKQGFIVWGSTAPVAIETAEALTAQGTPTSVLAVEMLSPLPAAAISDYVDSVERVAIPELSFSGQFSRLLRAEGVCIDKSTAIHRAGGDPLTVRELLDRAAEVWA